MNVRYKHYKKEFEHSYSFGVFPTLELLAHQPEHVLGVLIHPKGLENQGISKIQKICQEKGIPHEIQERVFPRLGARENDYALGVFRKYQSQLDPRSNHVVLINPGSMGNLGTIIRTMLGFGLSDLAIITPAADHFDPKVIRASMGAIFKMRMATFADFEAYQREYQRTYYPLMTGGEHFIHEVEYQPPYSLVFGNESSGLGDEFGAIGSSVSIPQSDAIDSFNLAVAVGVTLYQATLYQNRW
ncbi:MAG: TrmH family RNA methyltransferase [Anaerolineales bacterium]|nr:TrmH family RNA methyltransferase [Chloroflexota bacterium]MBL7161664.1 TrmH family RNA methyltransferase [Anaerolineales bacterium]